MSNKLCIQTVEVRYLGEGDRRSFGFFAFDEIACFNVLALGNEAAVPTTVSAIVAYCQSENLADVLEMFQHHAEIGNNVWLDGEAVTNAKLRSALAVSAPEMVRAVA